MVGILEGLAPLPGLRGVSEVSEQTERASCSSDASEASLPRRLLALLPARLPARLVGPLRVDAPRFGSSRMKKRAGRGGEKSVKKSFLMNRIKVESYCSTIYGCLSVRSISLVQTQISQLLKQPSDDLL